MCTKPETQNAYANKGMGWGLLRKMRAQATFPFSSTYIHTPPPSHPHTHTHTEELNPPIHT